MRNLIALMLAALLSGCNMVTSDQPWFSIDDEIEEPIFRDGLWVVDDPKCRFDEARSIADWPACAGFAQALGDTWYSPRWEKGKGQRKRKRLAGWTAESTVLANGDPIVLQIGMDRNRDDGKLVYYYFGVKPASLDGKGKWTAMRIWPTQCGPISRPSKKARSTSDGESKYVTSMPFHGLRVDSTSCKAESRAALLAATRSSEALAADIRSAHWVREGWQ